MARQKLFSNLQRISRLFVFVGIIIVIGWYANVLNAQSHAEKETIVRCDPVSNSVLLGDTFYFDIYIENVEGLSGADVQLEFDPVIVQPVDADSGVTGIQMELLDEFLHPDFVLRNTIDAEAGTIWYAAVQINSPENPRDPADGSGPLARVTFEAQNIGELEIPITYAKLSTADGFSIPFTPLNCSVKVTDEVQSYELYLPIILSG